MSMMAVAVVGSAVVGGVVANRSARKQAGAVKKGARLSADATVASTQLQVEEIQRQFDYQQQVLRPQIEQQFAAQRAYSDLLGIGGGAGTDALPANITPRAEEEAARAQQIQGIREIMQDPSRNWSPRELASLQNEINTIENRVYAEDEYRAYQSTQAPTMPGSGSTNFMRGPNGEFVDPNLRSTSLADEAGLRGQVESTLQAPSATPEGDVLYNYISGNQIAAPTAAEDARVARARDVTLAGERGGTTLTGTRGGDTLEARRGSLSLAGERGGVSLADERGGVSLFDARGNLSLADERGGVRNAGDVLTEDEYYQNVAGRSLASGAAGTGVYGETFEASPGYAFQVEEMQRALDRYGSRGGNLGGAAVKEALRRAQGLAAGDYYNWAAGRSQDLSRQATAEAADAARLDTAGQNYLGRRATDIARGDEFAQYDIGRGDQLMREDIARGDQFAQYDIGRGDEIARFDLTRGDTLAGEDVRRLDQFAATDIGRGDQFAQYDIGRGDAALDAYESQRIADIGRSDTAVENWLQRRQGDAARMDAAVAEQDRLRGVDLQRSDQAYYNYIQNVARQAGFGDSASQAVQASQAAGGAVAGAYGQQGAQLSNIYQNRGAQLSGIEADRGANVNNAIQSGIQNWVTYKKAG